MGNGVWCSKMSGGKVYLMGEMLRMVCLDSKDKRKCMDVQVRAGMSIRLDSGEVAGTR